MGSSPRVWGQVTKKMVDDLKDMDHPHACGDKQNTPQNFDGSGGSSPRVWGQGFLREFPQKNYRIIPTRVGTRQNFNFKFLHRKDHPHACGDKINTSSAGGGIIGSSPRVWGQVCW